MRSTRFPSAGSLRRVQSLCAVLAASSFALWMPAVRGAPPVADPLDTQIDTLVRDGYERPQAALAKLALLRKERKRTADENRRLLEAEGSIGAQAGRSAEAAAVAGRLLDLHRRSGDARAEAAAHLVQAQAAENAGRLDVAGDLARSALTVFEVDCPSSTRPMAEPAARTCDYRSAWRALAILQRRSMSLGLPAAQAAQAEAALALAEWAGDTRRQSENLAALAPLAQSRGDHALAQSRLKEATRLAVQAGDPAQAAVASSAAARIATLQGNDAGALVWRERARSEAALADAPRLEARMLNNLGNAYLRVGRPADALHAAERALPVVRQYGDLRAERVLMGNIGVAKIGLGRIAEGKRDLGRLIALWRESGEPGREAEMLVEFGEALAAAGDPRTALDLYHRERTLSDELARTDRAVLLKELQDRNAAQARLQEIALVSSDNVLKTAELASRDLQQRIGWVLSIVMLLATVLVALLYQRVRIANRKLAVSQSLLRSQNERDPLTSLANRRRFQTVVERIAGGHGFEGALLLVDIDHFKRVNDGHGHAAGDQVLIEVARRLDKAMRAEDLVVRWGGEEFLILLPSATLEQTEQTAIRLLHLLGSTPIACGHQSLRVTASIGYARFPLPPGGPPLRWEQAANLVDMALYTAKNQGRNRAIGIASSTVTTPAGLQAIEADFERAWRDGLIVLLQARGPDDGERLKAA